MSRCRGPPASSGRSRRTRPRWRRAHQQPPTKEPHEHHHHRHPDHRARQGHRPRRLQRPVRTCTSTTASSGSIRKEGVRQPIIVSNGRDDDNVTLVAGHRRLAAAKQAGLTEIPYTLGVEEKATADAAIENLARRNLNPVEEARAFKAMLDDGYSKDGIAKTTG